MSARKPSAAQRAVIADVEAGLDPCLGFLGSAREGRRRTARSCIRAGWIVERMEPVLRATPAGREAVRRARG